MSLSKLISVMVQIGGIANFAYAIYFSTYMVQLPASAPRYKFGGQWKYLTHWNLWIQLVFFTIGLLNQFFGSQEKDYSKASLLQKIRDFFFATVAFPIGIFVAVIFWSLWAVDRNLVFPVSLDKYFPAYVNHMLHTTVLPLQLLELFVVYHIYPRLVSGIGTTALFCFVYLSWTLVIAHYAGIWVYPIFEVLPTVARYLFMLMCSLLGGLLYLLGDFCNRLIWKASGDKGAVSKPAHKPKSKKIRVD